MIFIKKKISQNLTKSPLKICLISQISVHSLWHVWAGAETRYPEKSNSSVAVIQKAESKKTRQTKIKAIMHK